jgi:1,2-diacylglycerol 3-alpha-glucosyltransferase
MKILMFTNSFTPMVGGVARSVQSFAGEFRRRGHGVLIVAPLVEPGVPNEIDVLRLPAVQNFNGSDFSVPITMPGRIAATVRQFTPDIVHSHHPFLLGDTALRIAASRDIPVVFTHHTLYENYTHYVPGDSPRLKRFVVDLATGYGNLCDAVIAPSSSIAELIAGRGVKVPIEVIPTGIPLEDFTGGDGPALRRRLDIPAGAMVIGHIGRLAPEKNLAFLAKGMARFLDTDPGAHLLIVGAGPSRQTIQEILATAGFGSRLHLPGVLREQDLTDAYAAMDVFAFASRTETQGMVLTEAMAAGAPVIAIDAPGVREVVRDGENGRLLPDESVETFAAALQWFASLDAGSKARLRDNALRTAVEFSLPKTSDRTLDLYEKLIGAGRQRKEIDISTWAATRRRLEEEWRILRNLFHAAGDAVRK